MRICCNEHLLRVDPFYCRSYLFDCIDVNVEIARILSPARFLIASNDLNKCIVLSVFDETVNPMLFIVKVYFITAFTLYNKKKIKFRCYSMFCVYEVMIHLYLKMFTTQAKKKSGQ